MKLKHLLPLLFIAFSLFSCIERNETIKTYTISPSYTVAENTLKRRVAAIIPADTINFSSTHTEIPGGTEHNTLIIEIVTKRLPANGPSFSGRADEIQEIVTESISNIEDYKNVIIEVRLTEDEGDGKYNRSYKKEIIL